jgi:nicotinate-nucleotide pyrophosphorylase (carboxylating)
MILNERQLRRQVQEWLEEDVGIGDMTSMTTVDESLRGTGIIHAKSEGVLAGIPVLQAVFREVDPELEVAVLAQDGERLQKGTVIAEISGKVRSILTGERVALNIIQRLSGIASKTDEMVRAAKLGNPNVRVVDTRKTTPGLRMVEKYAVAVGGGHSHRYGLYDAVLIKDNHIKAAGGIIPAVQKARAAVPHTMTIEVEVESIPQVMEALEAKTNLIMFDNMPLEEMREAVKIIAGRALTEASGGIGMDNIAQVAATGVDMISLGSLTYSVQALDISLDLFERKR